MAVYKYKIYTAVPFGNMIRVEKYLQEDNMAESLYGLIKTASVQFIIDEESPKPRGEDGKGRATSNPRSPQGISYY